MTTKEANLKALDPAKEYRVVASCPMSYNPVLKDNGFRWDADLKKWQRFMKGEFIPYLITSIQDFKGFIKLSAEELKPNGRT